MSGQRPHRRRRRRRRRRHTADAALFRGGHFGVADWRRCPKTCILTVILAHILIFDSLGIVSLSEAVILTGSADSYARYPKWSQTAENELSFEFKTRSSNALLLYMDDGAVNGNFYALSIVDGRLQLDFRLGDANEENPLRRPAVQLRVNQLAVDDDKWHKFKLFQAWENVKLRVDDVLAFKILSQQSFAFGALRNNSDLFVGGLPTASSDLGALSAPLRRHARRFAGSLINLRYRLYPHGVSAPQLIDSAGTRQTADDYCSPADAAAVASAERRANVSSGETPATPTRYCRNEGHCYSTNTGPKCDCTFTDFGGRQCDTKQPIPEVSLYGNEWLGYDLIGGGVLPTAAPMAGDPPPRPSTLSGVWSRRETLSFRFRTTHANGLLFIAGDHQNYVQLLLEQGVLLAVSRLAGSDKRLVRVFNRLAQPPAAQRFDDGVWHHVLLYRDLKMMRVSVDGGWTDEVQQLVGNPMDPDRDDGGGRLGNAFAYVGGAPAGRLHVPPHAANFRGCIKQVRLELDTLRLELIALADQGFGASIVRAVGDVAFSCVSAGGSDQPPDVLGFHSGQEFLTLPKWNSLATGSLGFQFRTFEPDGLILYHGVRDFSNETLADFLAFELIGGYLFVVINLGSGHVRLQASARRVDEGNVWHSVTMDRAGRGGAITVDGTRTDFSTPGVSANLIIDEPIYVGAAPWPPLHASHKATEDASSTSVSSETEPTSSRPTTSTAHFPAAVWTAQLRVGFVGCLKNLRVNGINAQIAAAFEDELRRERVGGSAARNRGISTSCPMSEVDHCARHSTNPCQNFGRCSSVQGTFKCDCSATLFEGRTCNKKSKSIAFPLQIPPEAVTNRPHHQHPHAPVRQPADVFRLAGGRALHSEAENIRLRFRTDDDSAVLFDTAAPYAADGGRHTRLTLALLNGELDLRLSVGHNGSQHALTVGQSLNDNRWHYAEVGRRGAEIRLRVDDRVETKRLTSTDPSSLGIYVEEIAVGRAIRPLPDTTGGDLSSESQERSAFDGEFLTFHFNGYDVLEPMRRLLRATAAPTTRRSPTVAVAESEPSNTISIDRPGGFVGYSRATMARAAPAGAPFRFSFKFRTLLADGLLLAMFDEDRSADFIIIQLMDGLVSYTYGYRKAGRTTDFHSTNVTTPAADARDGRALRFDDLHWHTVDVQFDARSGLHRLRVDTVNASLRAPDAPRAPQIGGQLYLGGISPNYTVKNLPPALRAVRGLRACFSNLKVARSHLRLWDESDFRASVSNGCKELQERCAPSTCRNGGVCRQGWTQAHCDCAPTTFAGRHCADEATSWRFDGAGSAIFYEFGTSPTAAAVRRAGSDPTAPTRSADDLALAFRSRHSQGVLLSVACSVNDDFLTVFLDGGYVQVRYNLGGADHHVGYYDARADDGRRHVVRVWRRRANVTLALDAHMPVKHAPAGGDAYHALNAQWRVGVGASLSRLHERRARRSDVPATAGATVSDRQCATHRVYDAFHGNISGVNFNGLRILDLFAIGDRRTFCVGAPTLLQMAPPTFYAPSDDTADGDDESYGSDDEASNRRLLSSGAYANLFETDDLPSTSSLYRATATAGERPRDDALVDQSPLDCLPASAANDCERDDDPGDGFFTPILPKSAVGGKARPTPAPARTAAGQTGQNDGTASNNERRRKPSPAQPAAVGPTKPAGRPAGGMVTPPSSASGYYEPPGGWPPRTRTGQESRRRPAELRPPDSRPGDDSTDETEEDDRADPDDRDDGEDSGDEAEPPARYFNDAGEELRPQNGEKVKSLWTDLGRAIEQKPWQRPIGSSTVSDRNHVDQPVQTVSSHTVGQPPTTTSTVRMLYDNRHATTVKPSTKITTVATVSTTAKPTSKTTTTVDTTTTTRTRTEKVKITTMPVTTRTTVRKSTTTVPTATTTVAPASSMLFTFVSPHNDTPFVTSAPYVLSGASGGAYAAGAAVGSSTLRARTRMTPVYDHTLYAVRPTTPMNEIQYTTVKTSENYGAQIPRTALVVLASLSLVLIVAIILIFVFCKRSNTSENYYPMICSGNGKAMAGTAAGYTAIPPSTDTSPQFTHQMPAVTAANGGVVAQSVFDHSTVAANGGPGGYTNQAMTILRNGSNGRLAGGYQPINGSTLPHPAGHATPNMAGQQRIANGGGASSMINGGAATMSRVRQTTASLVDGGPGVCGTVVRTTDGISPASDLSAKKKDFKEWYV